jgi:endonuclease YncB( thermonuclease family)
MMSAPAMPTTMNAFRAAVLEMTDGDTFRARVWVLPDMYWEGKIRLSRVNAPERGTTAGMDAMLFTQRWLAGQPWPINTALKYGITPAPQWPLVIVVKGTDNFGGRLDAEVYRVLDGRNLSDDLLAANIAAPYRGMIATPMH